MQSTAKSQKALCSKERFTAAEMLNTRTRIGSTVYLKRVFVKNNNTAETMQDKIIRLMKNDLNFTTKNDKMVLLQTEQLPEGSSFYE